MIGECEVDMMQRHVAACGEEDDTSDQLVKCDALIDGNVGEQSAKRTTDETLISRAAIVERTKQRAAHGHHDQRTEAKQRA